MNEMTKADTDYEMMDVDVESTTKIFTSLSSGGDKSKKGNTSTIKGIRDKHRDKGNREELNEVIRGNYIIQTKKSKLSDAVDFVLDNIACLSDNTQNFLRFINRSETVKLRFIETTDGANDFGETALWVKNPNNTWGNLDADNNVRWNAIDSDSDFELRISLNGKHNFGDKAVCLQTVVHELIVHGLPYYKILKNIFENNLTGERFKKYWDNQTSTGFNNGDVQHYKYGTGRLADYNISVSKLTRRLELEPASNPTDKVGYGDPKEQLVQKNQAFSERHISQRFARESERDVAEHRNGYDEPPTGYYSSTFRIT